MRELILGGVRSGKSRHAETQAARSKEPVVYIATARADSDSEMAQRIAAHRQRRPAHWRTIEAPLELPEALDEHCRAGTTVIVDCLTLWLNNLLNELYAPEAPLPGPASDAPTTPLQARLKRLLQAVEQSDGRLLLVSNETGFGVIPANALARRFCDVAGSLHQELARYCERVTLLVAGVPLPVKEPAESDRG